MFDGVGTFCAPNDIVVNEGGVVRLMDGVGTFCTLCTRRCSQPTSDASSRTLDQESGRL